MLKKNLEDALNEQINGELWSAYLYLSMSLNFDHKGLAGIAKWYYVQFQEEQEHALRLTSYVTSRGSKVTLAPIEKVDTEWDSVLVAFEETLAHEKTITKKIDCLLEMAQAEKDYATETMLRWFINEQVEEEDSVNKILDKIRLIEEDGLGLYLIDKELGERTGEVSGNK